MPKKKECAEYSEKFSKFYTFPCHEKFVATFQKKKIERKQTNKTTVCNVFRENSNTFYYYNTLKFNLYIMQ